MAQIFISYSKHNIDFARHLRALLQDAGFEVWMDEIRLSTSQHWAQTIEKTITDSAIFMIILSPESKGSQWVARELLLAERLNKPIFPILYSGEVWWNLANIQYEDMRDGLRATLSERMVESIQAVLSGRVTIASDPLPPPPAQTDTRRLEAAMPAETQAATGTEVWAKISLPTSEGLRGELPAVVPSGDVIQKDDAHATTFPIQFAVDPQNGRRLPASAELRVISGDFDVVAPGERAAVEIPPEMDSRTVIFTLEPKPGAKTSGRTRIFIDLIYEMKIIAQISVSTQIVERVTAAIPTWNLMSAYAAPHAAAEEAVRGIGDAPLTLPEADTLDLSDETFDAEPPETSEFETLPAEDAAATDAAVLGEFQTLPAEPQTGGIGRRRAAGAALVRFATAAAAILLVFAIVVVVGRNNAYLTVNTAASDSVPTAIPLLSTEAVALAVTEAVSTKAEVAVAPMVDCTGTPAVSLVNLLQVAGYEAELLDAGITDQGVARASEDARVVVWGACSGDALWLYVELLDPAGREAVTAPPTITLIIPAGTVEQADSYATRLVTAVTEYARGGGGAELAQAFSELAETAMDEEDAAALQLLRDNSAVVP